MNIFKWEHANKLAIIFGIIGGFYLILQLSSYLFSEKIKFDSEILINDYVVAYQKNKPRYWEELRDIIPSGFGSYYLSKGITDSLRNNLDFSNKQISNIREIIEKAIPKELDQKYLIDRIDSLIIKETYPARETNSYISTFIKNDGDKIAKELRFEVPSNGYYELFINDELIKNGDFSSNIYIGELRPENIATIKIWAFKYISDYYVSNKVIKYTFDGGIVVPTILRSLKSKGIFYWIYKNPIWALYFLIWLPIYLTFIITKKLLNSGRESDMPDEKQKQPIINRNMSGLQDPATITG